MRAEWHNGEPYCQCAGCLTMICEVCGRAGTEQHGAQNGSAIWKIPVVCDNIIENVTNTGFYIPKFHVMKKRSCWSWTMQICASGVVIDNHNQNIPLPNILSLR